MRLACGRTERLGGSPRLRFAPKVRAQSSTFAGRCQTPADCRPAALAVAGQSLPPPKNSPATATGPFTSVEMILILSLHPVEFADLSKGSAS